MRRVVSLWLPLWPTDRLRRDHCAALTHDMPLVTRRHGGRRMAIAAADAAARDLGLKPGIAMAHAQAMVPDLAVVDAAEAEDASALGRLAAWCLRLSPMASADPPDGVWIDATGCTHLHGGERPMLSLLSGHLTRHGLTGRVAIVDTPGAARALARYGSQTATVVEPGAQADIPALLPVAALRLDDATVDGLRRLGLDLIGQLATAARGPLARTPRSPRPGHPPRGSRRHTQPGTIGRTWP